MNFFTRNGSIQITSLLLLTGLAVWFCASTSCEPYPGKTLCAEHAIRNRVDAMIILMMAIAHEAVDTDEGNEQLTMEQSVPIEPPLPGQSWSTDPNYGEWLQSVNSGASTNFVAQVANHKRDTIVQNLEVLLQKQQNYSMPETIDITSIIEQSGEQGCCVCISQRNPHTFWSADLPELLCKNFVQLVNKRVGDFADELTNLTFKKKIQ